MIRILSLFTFLISTTSFASSGINIDDIDPGNSIIKEWNGLPVLIYKRTSSELEKLQSNGNIQVDPKIYASAIQHIAKIYGNEIATNIFTTKNIETKQSRSMRNDILVTIGVSSYFGCFINKSESQARFIDPCSKATYDSNGRITHKNKREYFHLLIPPHYYKENMLFIGLGPNEKLDIIDFSPDIMAMNVSSGEKLLLAIEWHKYETLEKLLKSNNTITYETPVGATAMHVAANKSKHNVINLLVKYGFEVNIPTKSGITPLQMALFSENEDAAIALLQNKARTDKFCFKDRCTKDTAEVISTMQPSKTREDVQKYIIELKTKAL